MIGACPAVQALVVAAINIGLLWLPTTVNLAHGLEVPMPTLPALSTIKFVAVEEPMTKAGAELSATTGLIENLAHGEVVPTPMKPEFITLKKVLVDLFAEVEATTNMGNRGPLMVVVAAWIESEVPQGVVEPMPTLPVLVTVKRSVVVPKLEVDLMLSNMFDVN
jgi:hypothetical protein